MNSKNRHFHSIVVHPVVAFTMVAIVSFFCKSYKIEFLNLGVTEWHLLLTISLVIVFTASFPATISGVFETNKMYAKWHSTHKMKLSLSVLLILVSFIELYAVFYELNSLLVETLLYFINCIIIFLLSCFGLKITLGRQSLEKTSYIPDFFNKEKRLDILEEAKEYIKEKPKRVDFFDFGED